MIVVLNYRYLPVSLVVFYVVVVVVAVAAVAYTEDADNDNGDVEGVKRSHEMTWVQSFIRGSMITVDYLLIVVASCHQ